jgi:hypothetical protein
LSDITPIDMSIVTIPRLLTACRMPAAVVATVCAALLAACGSSSGGRIGAGPTGGPALQYAQCMRGHGVSNFPDPSSRGGLIVPNDVDPQSPTFRSAQRVCDKLPQARPAQSGSSESRRLQLLALATCMRSHGVADFADPTTAPPPPSHGNAVGGNGWYLSLGTASERRSPTYRRAAAACGGGAP